MEPPREIDTLRAALEAAGIRIAADGQCTGFPAALCLGDGHTVTLDLPEPLSLKGFDPAALGCVVLDHVGYPQAKWGIAQTHPLFQEPDDLLESPLGPIIESAFRGSPAGMYWSGYRFYSTGIEHGDSFSVLLLVTDAREEQAHRRLADRSRRDAAALKRVGRAISRDKDLHQTATKAISELADSLELAAALLWTRREDGDPFKLSAKVGTRRSGTEVISTLEPGEITCLAELVVATRNALHYKDVRGNDMTSGLEAKLCYLEPGGVSALPLMVGEKLIGVLELIGRDQDEDFPEHKELFETLAEHIALALNSILLYEGLERQATFDPLTGIANHRAMQDYLAKRLSEAERAGSPIGLIMLDVDHFRAFNEEEGHDAGDRVLKMVAGVLKRCVRDYDLAARYGGEEFTVILPTIGRDLTYLAAERIRTQIEALEYFTAGGRPRHITASFGVSIFPESAKDATGLLKAADLALYLAKRNGRNRTEIFEAGTLEQQPDRSLDLDQVRAWISPDQVEETQRIAAGSEALRTFLAERLSLSRVQARILEAGVLLAPTYCHALDIADTELLERMERASELRPVLPMLQAVRERYDGNGPRAMAGNHIPLLARTLSLLLATQREEAQAWLADTGRFDPEIVAFLAEIDAAA